MYVPGLKELLAPRQNMEHRFDAFEYYLFLFIAGSVAGWCMELVFRSVCHGGLRIPGFLFGPYCPIYGMGILLAELFSCGSGKAQTYFRVVIAASALEYVISFICETLFGRLLWDYSMLPFSIGTRVNLLFSLAWGFLGLAFVYCVEPWVRRVYEQHAIDAQLFSRFGAYMIALDTLCSVAASV